MGDFKIEDDVPMPGHNACRARTPAYPFFSLEVGQSFLVACETGERRKLLNRLSGHLAQAKRKTGHTYASRSVDGGIRVWRTA